MDSSQRKIHLFIIKQAKILWQNTLRLVLVSLKIQIRNGITSLYDPAERRSRWPLNPPITEFRRRYLSETHFHWDERGNMALLRDCEHLQYSSVQRNKPCSVFSSHISLPFRSDVWRHHAWNDAHSVFIHSLLFEKDSWDYYGGVWQNSILVIADGILFFLLWFDVQRFYFHTYKDFWRIML